MKTLIKTLHAALMTTSLLAAAGAQAYFATYYHYAVTKAEYENVNEQVKREGKAALLPDDLAAVYAAAAACKKKADENELIAATPLGG